MRLQRQRDRAGRHSAPDKTKIVAIVVGAALSASLKTADSILDQLPICRMVNIFIANRNFVEFDFARKRLFLETVFPRPM